MRKVFLIILSFLLVMTSSGVAVYAETSLENVFPDVNFLSAVCEKLGTDDASEAFSAYKNEIASFTELSVSGRNIKSIEGIEYFTALEILDISNNELTEMDLSANMKLTILIADENPIITTDISENEALKEIYIQNCKIKKITLPDYAKKVFLAGNELDSVRLNALSALEELNLKDNRLTYVSISDCENLKYLWLDGNRLENIDLPEAEFETVILGTQEYNLGVKGERTYSPSWNILSSSVVTEDGGFKFTSDKLPVQIDCTVNISGYPMLVEFTAVDMRGDVTSDDAVNSDDLSYVLYHYGTDDSAADIDGTGTVSAEDLSVVLSTYGNYADR